VADDGVVAVAAGVTPATVVTDVLGGSGSFPSAADVLSVEFDVVADVSAVIKVPVADVATVTAVGIDTVDGDDVIPTATVVAVATGAVPDTAVAASVDDVTFCAPFISSAVNSVGRVMVADAWET